MFFRNQNISEYFTYYTRTFLWMFCGKEDLKKVLKRHSSPKTWSIYILMLFVWTEKVSRLYGQMNKLRLCNHSQYYHGMQPRKTIYRKWKNILSRFQFSEIYNYMQHFYHLTNTRKRWTQINIALRIICGAVDSTPIPLRVEQYSTLTHQVSYRSMTISHRHQRTCGLSPENHSGCFTVTLMNYPIWRADGNNGGKM